MALIQDGRSANGLVAIEQKTKALRVTDSPRGTGFSLSGTSGVVAAAAAVNGCFWSMRLSTSTGGLYAFVEKFRLQFVTIAAFTTPVTAGRRLSLYRGSTAATTGGTALTPIQKDVGSNLSQINSANGGDARIATTATLSVSGIVWESAPIREMTLTQIGTAGGSNEDVYDFAGTTPIVLQPGQILGLRNPQAMDAAGTWQIQVDVDWHESVPWGSSTAD